MKYKLLFLFLLIVAYGYAQAPLNFSARLNVTNVSGSDPYTLIGVVQDELGLWSAADLNVTADSIYHLNGSDLLIYRITSITSASGNNFTIVVDDIMNSGILPSSGNQWAALEFTTNYQFPVEIGNLATNFKAAIDNRFKQRLDAIIDALPSPTTYSASQGVIDSSNVFQLGNPTSVTNSADRFLTDRYIPLNGKKLNIGDATNTALQIDGTSSLNRLGFFTTAPSTAIGIGGETNRTMRMERITTANSNGSNLTIQAGGATVGATDKSGGNLILSAGESTGTGLGAGGGNIVFTVPVPSTSGTSDNFIFTRMLLTREGRLGVDANFAAPILETLALGNNGGTTATMSMHGITSGKVIIKPADAAGTYTLTLPTNDGDAGQALVTNGSGVTSWSGSVGNVSDGIYTPTITLNLGTDTINSVSKFLYSRNDSIFSISGQILMNSTAGTISTSIQVSLPPGITSNFTVVDDVSGVVNSRTNVTPATMKPARTEADVTNNTIVLALECDGSAATRQYLDINIKGLIK